MGIVIKGIFTNLTPSEKIFLLRHPQLVSVIKNNAEKALLEARKKFPGASLHNGEGDAFRHCFWSALLARDIGASYAKQFTTAHENYSDNPPKERGMDLYNNSVGFSIGLEYPKASDGLLSMRCMAALLKGKLMTSLPEEGSPYDN